MKFFLFEWHRNVLMAAKTTFTVCIFILLQFFLLVQVALYGKVMIASVKAKKRKVTLLLD